MQSKTVYPKPNSFYCELEYPKAVRFDNGYIYAMHTDRSIYLCSEQVNGRWPIKREIYSDDPFYRTVVAMFEEPQYN